MKIKPIRFKPIRLRFNFDTDRDGVFDWRDCSPFNPRRQDIGPSEYTVEIDRDAITLLKKLQKEAYSRYDNSSEAKKLALAVASRAMEQKTQTPRFGLGMRIEEDFPHSFVVKFYIPSHFSGMFGEEKTTYLDIHDQTTDVHFYVDVSGYIHTHSSFRYSGPFTRDIYHVRGKRLFAPRLVFAITGVDREKFGREFDTIFQILEQKQKLG